MSLFVLDTAGDQELLKNAPKYVRKPTRRCLLEDRLTSKVLQAELEADVTDDNSDDDCDYFGLPPPNVDISKLIDTTLLLTEGQKSKAVEEMEYAAEMVDAAVAKGKTSTRAKHKNVQNLDYSDFNPQTGKFDEETTLVKIDVNKELERSDVICGLEQLKELPSITKKKQRQLGRIERSKSKGAGWFNLPATELTEEVENDLKVLQMRSVLDPKHFYKKNDLKVLPKYFQIGTVQHSPLDYYSERNTRKNKKTSLVEELLADAEVQKYTKRKYKETIARHDKYAHRKAMKKMKKLKKK